MHAADTIRMRLLAHLTLLPLLCAAFSDAGDAVDAVDAVESEIIEESEIIDLDSGTEARFRTCEQPNESKYYRLDYMACHETCFTSLMFRAYNMLQAGFMVAPVADPCLQFGYPVYWTSKLRTHVISVEPEYDVYLS